MIPLIAALLAVVTSLIISILVVSETEKIKEKQERPATKEEFESEDLFNTPYEKKISYDSDDENLEIPEIQIRISDTRQVKDYSLIAAQNKIQRSRPMQMNFGAHSIAEPFLVDTFKSTDDFWNNLTASSPQLAEVPPELLDQYDVPLPHTEHTEYKIEVRTRNRGYVPGWKDRPDLFLESYNKYIEKKKKREQRRLRRRNNVTSNSEPPAGSQDSLRNNNNNNNLDNISTRPSAQPAELEDEGEDFGNLGVIKCLTADPDAEDICIANTVPPKANEDSDSEQDDDRDIDMVMRKFGKSAKKQGMDLRNFLKEIKEEDKQKKKMREDMLDEHRQAVEFRNREIFEYSLWKRFSDIDELHNQLIEQFWKSDIPVPDLPHRSITAERTDPAFIELRRQQLEDYLSVLVADDTIRRSRFVQAFLRVREGFDVEERKPKDTTYEGAKKFLKEQIEAIPVVDDPDIEAD